MDYLVKEVSDFFETRVVTLETNKDKKNLLLHTRTRRGKSRKKQQDDYNVRGIESRKESFVYKNYNKLHRKCIHTTINYMDLKTIVNKHKK